MGSLRFRLPALFLVAIALSGLIATAIALRLIQDSLHDQTVSQLRHEVNGAASLYRQLAGGPVKLSPQTLEEATGNLFYYVPPARGFTPFLKQPPPFRRLPRSAIPYRLVAAGNTIVFDFNPPGTPSGYIAVAKPLTFGSAVLGAIVVASPKARLHNALVTLLWRLLAAFAIAVLVAGLFAIYLTRRITNPVLALSRAADEVARGNYAAPEVHAGGEIGHLSLRFQEMTARLAEAEQLERHFLMTVSHELRTPLTAIRGHVAALREGVIQDEEARAQSLEVVAEETARLERLVGDVLDLAKLEAKRFTLLREEVDMERLVDRAYATFGEEARRRGIDYERELDGRPVIVADGDRVLQIISNLLSNAFRWTPDGGRIELALSQENGTVHVAVEDSGPGISPEERERIFRPFWSHDDGGTGLGLAIARELAIAHGGRIELESEPGHGSRFELVLPATLPDS
jgi:signal transduction histidine kinase